MRVYIVHTGYGDAWGAAVPSTKYVSLSIRVQAMCVFVAAPLSHFPEYSLSMHM